MKTISKKLGVFGVAAVLLFLACGIISVTWIVSFKLAEDTTLRWYDNFYYGQVELSDSSDWEEHKDNIKDIDMVGFELWATNNTDTEKSYSVYASYEGSGLNGLTSRPEIEGQATLILDSIPLSAKAQAGLPLNSTYITYGQSFAYLNNIDKLKDYVKKGSVRFFAMEMGGADTTDVHIDSMLVIVTFTAGL